MAHMMHAVGISGLPAVRADRAALETWTPPGGSCSACTKRRNVRLVSTRDDSLW